MSRAQDPVRMLTAALAGAGWRTALDDEVQAIAELAEIGDRYPGCLPQAAANAAEMWSLRADGGLVDVGRARTAAERLTQLAVDGDGQPVPARRETPTGGHQIPNLPPR